MNLFRQRFPEAFRLAALVALWAMLLPVGVGIFHTPMAMSMPAHEMAMHDCNGGGHTEHHDNKTHQVPSCPICKSMFLLGNGFIPADITIVSAPPVATPFYRVAKYDVVIQPVIYPQSRPRAPPALV